MKTNRAILTCVSVLVGIMVLSGGQVLAVNCGDLLTADTTLEADLECPGTALIIGADGITLDLNGHSLIGAGTGMGVDNTAGYDSVTIKGGVIVGFEYGLFLVGADNNSLTKLEVLNSVNNTGVEGVGILLWLNNDNNIITENYVHNNDRQGIYLGCDPWAFSGSASDCDDQYAEDNLITENQILDNGQADFDGYGIQLQFADGNVVSENTISGHQTAFWFAVGIYVLSSSDNIIEENEVTYNWFGTVLWDCGLAGTAHGNTFRENEFVVNTTVDMWDINGTNTTWDENKCGSSSPGGLCE